MEAELIVAAVQPRIADGEVGRNVDAHAELVGQARARLVVFPELSLTGYVLDAPAVDITGPVLRPLVRASAATGSASLVGAPVETGGDRYIATVLVDGSGATVAYRKTFLGSEEERCFRAGPGPRTVNIDSWRVGMGICRDTGIDKHVQGTAALGVDLYACGVLHHEAELAEQQRRGRGIARTCHAPVVMSSFAGPTGGGYVRTSGRSAIWSATGAVLAEANDQPAGIARVVLRQPHTSLPTDR